MFSLCLRGFLQGCQFSLTTRRHAVRLISDFKCKCEREWSLCVNPVTQFHPGTSGIGSSLHYSLVFPPGISPVFLVSPFFIVHATLLMKENRDHSYTVVNAQRGNGAEGRPLFLSLFPDVAFRYESDSQL